MLEKEFDLLDLILEHRYTHHHVSSLGHEADFMTKINVDRSDDEKEEDEDDEKRMECTGSHAVPDLNPIDF